MRLTIEGTAIIDCGGTIASLGWEEYNKRYSEQLVKSHIKLSQLEDNEDELGIGLLTLIKAVKQQTVWVKYENKIRCCDECEYVLLEDFIHFYWNTGEHKACSIKDYGKTWALTEEELKDEKNC